MKTDTSNVHINRKEYWTIFFLLFVLTVLEVGVVFVPGISNFLLIVALVLLAIVRVEPPQRQGEPPAATPPTPS